MSDVPRSLQSRVSTIQTVVLEGDIFQLTKNIITADVLQYFYELKINVISVVLTADLLPFKRLYSQLTFFNLKNICFLRKLKNVSCEYDLFEWLKLNFAGCAVYQTRSYTMVFVN